LDIQSSDVTLRVVILVDCRDPSPICLSVCFVWPGWVWSPLRLVVGLCPYSDPWGVCCVLSFFGSCCSRWVCSVLTVPLSPSPVHWCFWWIIHSGALILFTYICILPHCLKREKGGVFKKLFCLGGGCKCGLLTYGCRLGLYFPRPVLQLPLMFCLLRL
jgi:hypothetical protein